jgi:hypothetical protein
MNMRTNERPAHPVGRSQIPLCDALRKGLQLKARATTRGGVHKTNDFESDEAMTTRRVSTNHAPLKRSTT